MQIFKSNLSFKKFLSSGGAYAREYLSQLNSEYEKYKDEPIRELSFTAFAEYFRSGSRLAYENEYFHRRTLLRDFALKAWLGDDGALKRLENIMRAVCSERTWVLPAHLDSIQSETIDLFAAETSQTLTEIISLLDERISDKTVQMCISEVKKRVLDPFINRSEPYNWESMKNNWCAVCGGCVGMTALYLTEDGETLKSITDSLKHTFDSYISSFAEDGACLEGLYYWNYGMMYFTAFLDLYKQRIGKDFPVNIGKVRKMADFARKCCISDGITVSFSDGYESDRIYSGLSCRLNKMYGVSAVESEYISSFSGDGCGRWCRAVRDIAWTEVQAEEIQKENTILPDSQWALLRGEGMSVAFKGGNNGEPHNHNDVGSIIAVKNGEALLCDIGAGEYTSEYFSDRRYNIFCNRSMGHSVPIINGCEQKAGSEYASCGFFADGGMAGADISGAYGIAYLRECVRAVRCDGDKAEIEDKFILDEETEITERFITRRAAVAESNGVKIMSDGKQIASLITGSKCSIEIKTYGHHEHDGSMSDITAIDFKFTAKGKYKFLVKIL